VQDQTACVNVPTFNTVNLSVNRQDVIFTSSTVASNLIPSAISISEISVTPPLIAPICSDIGTKPESGKWAQDISLGGMLNGGSSIGGTGGSDFGGNLVSAINELQASLKNNYLKINAGIKKIAQVNVYNATGQLLMKTQDSNSEIELPFKKNLSPSFYLVEIFFTDGSKATKKISY